MAGFNVATVFYLGLGLDRLRAIYHIVDSFFAYCGGDDSQTSSHLGNVITALSLILVSFWEGFVIWKILSCAIGQLVSWDSIAKFPKFLPGLWTSFTCILVYKRRVQCLASFIGTKILFFGLSLDSLLRPRATHCIRAYRRLHLFFSRLLPSHWAPLSASFT